MPVTAKIRPPPRGWAQAAGPGRGLLARRVSRGAIPPGRRPVALPPCGRTDTFGRRPGSGPRRPGGRSSPGGSPTHASLSGVRAALRVGLPGSAHAPPKRPSGPSPLRAALRAGPVGSPDPADASRACRLQERIAAVRPSAAAGWQCEARPRLPASRACPRRGLRLWEPDSPPPRWTCVLSSPAARGSIQARGGLLPWRRKCSCATDRPARSWCGPPAEYHSDAGEQTPARGSLPAGESKPSRLRLLQVDGCCRTTCQENVRLRPCSFAVENRVLQ